MVSTLTSGYGRPTRDPLLLGCITDDDDAPAATQPARPTPLADRHIIGLFEMKVDQQVAAGLSRRDATRAVVAADPDLHRRYVAACTAQAHQKRDERADVTRREREGLRSGGKR